MTGKDVFAEKDYQEKATALKRFEYSPLGKELKAETSVVEKQYQKLNKIFESDDEEEPITIKKEKLEIIHEHEPKLICNKKYSFSEYGKVAKYMDDSPESEYNRLAKFYNSLNEFEKFTPSTVNRKEKKKTMYNC